MKILSLSGGLEWTGACAGEEDSHAFQVAVIERDTTLSDEIAEQEVLDEMSVVS